MSEASSTPALAQINIVVRDMKKSLAFYRLLGLTINEIPVPEWAPHHASGMTSNGVQVEFDSLAFAKQWRGTGAKRRQRTARRRPRRAADGHGPIGATAAPEAAFVRVTTASVGKMKTAPGRPISITRLPASTMKKCSPG